MILSLGISSFSRDTSCLMYLLAAVCISLLAYVLFFVICALAYEIGFLSGSRTKQFPYPSNLVAISILASVKYSS